MTVEGGTYAQQFVGPAGDCGMEKGLLYSNVPPKTLLLFNIMQSPPPGLYRNNIKLPEVSTGEITFYGEEGQRGALYTHETGVPELIALLHSGDTYMLNQNAFFRIFLWDTELRPMNSVIEYN